MRPQIPTAVVLQQASALLGQSLADGHEAGAGADHLIVFATTPAQERIVIKIGEDAYTDAYVLDQLRGQRVRVPRLLAQGAVAADGEHYPAAVMTCLGGDLLASVEAPHRYLPALVDQMRRVHRITTTRGAGTVLQVAQGAAGPASWKDYLLSILRGENPAFDWDVLSVNPLIDPDVLQRSRALVAARVEALAETASYHLLHGDLNPYNVLVAGDELMGIIDWSYARYGDPPFDFARLRMNPFVRQEPAARALYFSCLDLTPEERDREETYYLFNLVEYLNWYTLSRMAVKVREHIALLKDWG
jgi:aminoglycoside phosphotransferase (APT) family kinase protein